MNYYIEELNNLNTIDWIRLCEESNEGSFFHTLKWKEILEKSFHYKNHSFILYRNDEPVALCPFYEAAIYGIKGLVSLPSSDHNHIIITDKEDPLIAYHILDKCREIAKENKLFFILITTLSELTKDYFNSYKPLPYIITGNMMLNLEELPSNKIWSEILSKRERKHIRAFEKDGFRIKEVTSIEDIKTFFKYYKKNLEYINATPYPFSHFKDLLNTYSSKEMTFTLLYKNETIVGGGLAFLSDNKKTMYLRYLSLNRNVPTRYRPTYKIWWDCINKASEMGYSRVCFGRTPPYSKDIHYQFKEKFGCHYEKEYSCIFSTSHLFKLLYTVYYNIYIQAKKYKYR